MRNSTQLLIQFIFLSITLSFLMHAHNLRRNFSLRSSLSLSVLFFLLVHLGIHSVCQIEIMDQFSLSTAWNDCEIFFEAQGCSEWSSIVFRPSEGRQNYAGVLSLHISASLSPRISLRLSFIGVEFFPLSLTHSLPLSLSASCCYEVISSADLSL